MCLFSLIIFFDNSSFLTILMNIISRKLHTNIVSEYMYVYKEITFKSNLIITHSNNFDPNYLNKINYPKINFS
jgi:hypothetical protein